MYRWKIYTPSETNPFYVFEYNTIYGKFRYESRNAIKLKDLNKIRRDSY